MRRLLIFAAILSFALQGVAQTSSSNDLSRYQPVPYVKLTHPDWSKNAAIYQINTRQFSQEGTFRAIEPQLPRLKTLGVSILWVMPVQKIGVKNRKGTLGSPYSIQDYYRVNPEFGTMDDWKHFVNAAHAQGFHVILDWVGNHTSWDNVLVTQHPDWYEHNARGNFTPTPWFDWDDIIDLDYSKPALRKYMTDAMKFWVRDTGVDGYRCDAAGLVPQDFWDEARKELDAIKPVFMLAEWQSRDMEARAFDMIYGWSWYGAVSEIARGKKSDLGDLSGYYAWDVKFYPTDGITMNFVSNHDKNAWEGTEFEAFGPGLYPSIVLSVLSTGMPLIYNGQEAGYNHRLKFFEKDPIVWKSSPEGDLYTKLLALKTKNTALWNAHWGSQMTPVVNSAPSQVLSFVRENDRDKVFAAINFSDKPQDITLKDAVVATGDYTEYLTGTKTHIDTTSTISIEPWSYKVLVK